MNPTGPIAEQRIEIVEQAAALLDTRHIRQIGARQAVDHRRNATRLGACELAVLEVDVVHDLADRRQRGIVAAALLQQHLEGAAIALVGELGLEHVEPKLARPRTIALRGDELE